MTFIISSQLIIILLATALFVIGLALYARLRSITLIDAIDGFNRSTGLIMPWVLMVLVLVQFSVVILRYVFAIGFIWLQEAVWYLYAFSFMLTAAWVLLQDGHVRIDIFYRDWSPLAKARVNLFGSALLLLPVMILTIWVSSGYVVNSWLIFEGSTEVSGLPFLFLLKTTIWFFAVSLALQGVSLMAKSILLITTANDRQE